ncbi:hypothetical protein M5D96_002034, partial [Drosophila gunungcola]
LGANKRSRDLGINQARVCRAYPGDILEALFGFWQPRSRIHLADTDSTLLDAKRGEPISKRIVATNKLQNWLNLSRRVVCSI